MLFEAAKPVFGHVGWKKHWKIHLPKQSQRLLQWAAVLAEKKRLTNIIYQKSSGCNLMRFFAPKLNCIRIPIKIPKWWSDRPIFWQTKPLTGNEETSQRLACWSMETINKSGPAKFKMDLEKKHDVLESRLNVKFLGVYFIPFGGFVSL